jgi:ferritin
MISSKMVKALNKQIQEEMYSAYLYYAMAAWADGQNFTGMGSWLKVQAMEEVTHAHRFFVYLRDRGGKIELLEIKKPPNSWDSPLAAFEAAYKHEQHITACINDLVKLAREENDYTTETGVLHWFVNEQIEEEANTSEAVQKLKMVGDNQAGLYQIDREMAARIFTWPVDLQSAGPAAGA